MFNKLKPKSEFTRNVLTLMTGTTIAQAIPIAISPILTRIYTPEDFGLFALYISIVSFIAIVITARYEMAIVLPKSDIEAINIVALSIIITFILVLITSICLIVFKNEILNILNAKSLGNLIFLIPISLLMAGLMQTFNYWSNRKEYFSTMSNSQIAQSVSVGIMQPVLGYFNFNSGLIIGNIIGRILSAYILIDKFLKNDKEKLKHINKKNIIVVMQKYKDFPLVNSLHAFSDIIRTSGSVMLISSFFGTSILGFYALSLRALQVPIGIIGSALGQVLYKKFTSIYNENENLYPYVKKVVFKLFLIATPIFGTLFLIAPELFAFVFGEKWRIAGEYSQILIPYLFLNFIISPISNIPIIIGKQKEIFFLALIGNLLYVIIITIVHSLGIKITLICLSSFMVIYYFYIFYWLYKNLK